MNLSPKKLIDVLIILNFIIGLSIILIHVYASTKNVAQDRNSSVTIDPVAVGLASIGAAISVTGSCIAAGLALRSVASAGFAASAEKPELRSYMIIIGGLAEGIAIYGLLIAMMILSKI